MKKKKKKKIKVKKKKKKKKKKNFGEKGSSEILFDGNEDYDGKGRIA